jgi:hypothetical protein
LDVSVKHLACILALLIKKVFALGTLREVFLGKLGALRFSIQCFEVFKFAHRLKDLSLEVDLAWLMDFGLDRSTLRDDQVMEHVRG